MMDEAELIEIRERVTSIRATAKRATEARPDDPEVRVLADALEALGETLISVAEQQIDIQRDFESMTFRIKPPQGPVDK